MMVFSVTSGREPLTYHLVRDCSAISGHPWISEDSLVDLKDAYPNITPCRRCCR